MVAPFAGLAGKVAQMGASLPKTFAGAKQLGANALKSVTNTAKSVKTTIQQGLAKRAENKAQANAMAVPQNEAPKGTAEPKADKKKKKGKKKKKKQHPDDIKKTGFIERVGQEIEEGLNGIRREGGHGEMFQQGYKIAYGITMLIAALVGGALKGGAQLASLPFKGGKPGLKAVPGTVASLNGEIKKGTPMFAGLRQAVKQVMSPKSAPQNQPKPALPKPGGTESKITGQKQKATAPKMGK